MIGRVPRHRSLGDNIDPSGLFVFIPGALVGGFLISLGLLVGDALRRVRGNAAAERRVVLTGAALSEEVRSGAGAARRTESGLRSRRVYGVVAGLCLALVLLVVPGATWNFLNPEGYISNISWIWAISMVLALVFAYIGVQVLRLAPEYTPVIFLALGLAIAVRFAAGNEPVISRTVLIIIGLAIGATGAGATWKLRRRRNQVDVPPSVRPLLSSTPLGRAR